MIQKSYMILVLILLPLVYYSSLQSNSYSHPYQINKVASQINIYKKNTPTGQEGLIENNPGYRKYIPHTSTYPNQTNIQELASNFSTFTSKFTNKTAEGQEGLVPNNPGYARYIPNTSSYLDNPANNISSYYNSHHEIK